MDLSIRTAGVYCLNHASGYLPGTLHRDRLCLVFLAYGFEITMLLTAQHFISGLFLIRSNPLHLKPSGLRRLSDHVRFIAASANIQHKNWMGSPFQNKFAEEDASCVWLFDVRVVEDVWNRKFWYRDASAQDGCSSDHHSTVAVFAVACPGVSLRGSEQSYVERDKAWSALRSDLHIMRSISISCIKFIGCKVARAAW